MFDQTVMLQPALSPAEILLPWLKHESSLTDKLKNERGDASLSVLNQQWKNPDWWDKFVLGITTHSVMHREIIMSAHGDACWYARTIIPDYCYQVNASFFDRLKHESLGVMIFNTPMIKRKQMIHYSIDKSSLEYYWIPQDLSEQNSRLWARLSIFSLDDTAFYLVEILLPGLLRTIN